MNRVEKKVYRNYLIEFMSYLHGVQYDNETIFDQESLIVTPDEITRWLCLKSFGVEFPEPDENPTVCRSTSLEVYKKALSWYMPNNLSGWDHINNTGNPTKSKPVNDLINYVRLKEVRKQGVAPAAKRALTQAEFRAILVFFYEKNTFQYRYRYSSMLLYQYYLIARCDDVAHFLLRDLHAHTNPEFASFALQTKVTWSKNVLEERNCPDQVFFGSFDPQYCLLLSLSMYLEVWFGDSVVNHHKEFLFADDDASDPRAIDRIKAKYSATLRKYFVEFVRLSKECGTHSIRKFAASWARALGCLLDEIEGRGRWRTSNRRVVNRYVNIDQQYLDAKVAAILCVGGAIKYALVEDSGVTIPWLKENVVPGLYDYFGDEKIVDVLALPLLWVCMNPDMINIAPLTIATRIKEAYEKIRVLDLNVNPVKRVFIAIDRFQDTISITEAEGPANGSGRSGGGVGGTNNNNNDNNMVLLIIQQFRAAVTAQFDSLQQQQNNFRSDTLEKFSMLVKNLNRIQIQPPRMATPQQHAHNNFLEAAAAIVRPVLKAELGKCPKTIFNLWEEYAFGVGGNKAAKDFTSQERGKVRHNYSRRKVVWDCISLHCHAGFLATYACEQILDAYGRNQTVTYIINEMTKDKKTGGHPNLRV